MRRQLSTIQPAAWQVCVLRYRCLAVVTWSLLLVALLTLSGGCHHAKRGVYWDQPCVAKVYMPRDCCGIARHLKGSAGDRNAAREMLGQLRQAYRLSRNPYAALEIAELAYYLGNREDARQLAGCVDHYYEVVGFSWAYLRTCPRCFPGDEVTVRAWELYHSGLTNLISAGQRHGRLDPRLGLTIDLAAGPRVVPITFHGFVWRPRDFSHLELVGDYYAKKLTTHYHCDGIGVPLVAIRCRQPSDAGLQGYFGDRHPFAATAVLRPNVEGLLGHTPIPPRGAIDTLELYDPLRAKTIVAQCGHSGITSDISAPLAYSLRQSNWNPIVEFLRPETDTATATLRMLEPYQPGKIPLLFIHGLLSDPLTYVAMANEIRANPRLNERYQIWAFRYPTGGPFLTSAAELRSKLKEALAHCAAVGPDPALSQVVVVGHSMGGLVAKLQITYSGTILWDHIANRPLQSLVMGETERRGLSKEFFFQPSPAIRRVIYVATPHRGSPWARRPVGRLASGLVRFSPIDRSTHRQIVADNPGVFDRSLQKRIPTSVDLLEVGNPLINAMLQLPTKRCVAMHSIIGTGCRVSLMGESDSVVPVYSAEIPGVQSECYVDAKHTTILQKEDTIHEVQRILFEHLSTLAK